MMNSTPLVSNDNINNMQQFCKGCEKNLPSSSFIAINGNLIVHAIPVAPKIRQFINEN